MLDVSVGPLIREVEASEKVRDMHLVKYQAMRRRYHGQHYKGRSTESTENFRENHYYNWVSLVVPKLVYDNPRVKVTSRRPGSQGEIATAIQAGLNRWVRDVDLRNELVRGPAVDMQFNYGVLLVRNEEIPGAKPTEGVGGEGRKGIPWAPRVYRIAPDRYIQDALATTQDEIRFRGHMIIRDKEDILREAEDDPDSGWNVEMVQGLGEEDDSINDLGRQQHIDVRRGEVSYYEIWVPEIELEGEPGPSEGFNGAIYTVSTGQSSGSDETEYLREPRPFYGPADGPYVHFGVYTVPGDPYPLSPLVAVEEQISELNNHVASASRSANDYKKLVFVDASDPKLQQTVKSGEHHWVIPVHGLDKQKIVEVEIAGITPQQIQYIEIARDRLDRNSGIADAQRGVTGTSNSATEASIANDAAQTRLGFVSQQFSDCTAKLLERAAWYLYHDNRVAYPLGSAAAQELGMQATMRLGENGEITVIPPEPFFLGGVHKKDSPYTFEDLEVEIELYSMARTNEGLLQRQTMDGIGLLMQIAQMAPLNPHINWPEVIQMISDTLNLPGLGQLYNPQIAAELTQLQLQAQMEPPPNPTQQDPMLKPKGGGVEMRLDRTTGRSGGGAADSRPSPMAGEVAGPNAARGGVV